jgi:hypothetical protein
VFGLKFDNGVSRLGLVSSKAGLGRIAPISQHLQPSLPEFAP